MTDFRTMVSPRVSSHTMDLTHQIMTVGSCFADAIGSRLQQLKIKTQVNPFGVIYNPVSIHKVLRYAIATEEPSAHTYTQLEDVHLNYDFHSEFSALHKEDLQKHLIDTLRASHHFLKDASWIMLTYGTSFVYRRTDTDEIVANCHKQPAGTFQKSLLTPEAIEDSFNEMYVALKKINPAVRIIVTVSPVRHIKDTLELNNVSKSILRLVCHNLSRKYPDVAYYPAYEIMMDDLRDYRFYKRDMLHPTTEAEDYIWQHFTQQYFNAALKTFMPVWATIQSALNHKAFHPSSTGHQLFLRQTLQRLEELKSIVNVDEEIKQVQSQLQG